MNFGGVTELEISPTAKSYLKFSIQGLTGAVTSATLRLFAVTDSSDGFSIHALADSTWEEEAITFTTAPVHDETAAAQSGPVTLGTWVEVDVTSLVSGNGTVSLVLAGGGTSPLSLASREQLSRPPELVVTTTP